MKKRKIGEAIPEAGKVHGGVDGYWVEWEIGGGAEAYCATAKKALDLASNSPSKCAKAFVQYKDGTRRRMRR